MTQTTYRNFTWMQTSCPLPTIQQTQNCIFNKATMMNTATWGHPQMGGYTTVEMLLDDVSKQMTISNQARFSRGSNGQKTGGSMRIVKPNSASNSPRNSIGLGRRRTVMNDGAYRRRLAMMDQNTLLAGGFMSNDGLQIPVQARASRPVSWHPASHLAPQQPYQSYAAPATDMNRHYHLYGGPSTPLVYSGYASPDPTFSPLSMPFVGNDQEQYYPNPQATTSTGQYIHQQHNFLPQENESSTPHTTLNTDPSMSSHFDWNNFAMNGFENSSTAPPTPENFLPIQHPEPIFPAEDAIPYHPLEENESDDGEELIGMGLYDAPEISKSSSADPQLDNYRALMISSLLGSGYAPPRRVEPTGKGLKLEETWAPASDDEDQEDDDDEQDGEGEDDEEPELTAMPEVSGLIPRQHEAMPAQRNYGNYMDHQAYARDGWL